MRGRIKRVAWVSAVLLLASYASFGWFLAGPSIPHFNWFLTVCHWLQMPASAPGQNFCEVVIQENVLAAVLAIAWIVLTSVAFMSPLTSFMRFIGRWFKSDAVAFLSVFLLAAMATFILFWLHIFIQILTILATEALARLDIQALGLGARQAFWILTIVSLMGLSLGWIARLTLFP